MAKVNRKWHDENRMPKKASTRERIKWHLAHAKACGCRPMPAKIQRITEESSTKATKPVKESTSKKKK